MSTKDKANPSKAMERIAAKVAGGDVTVPEIVKLFEVELLNQQTEIDNLKALLRDYREVVLGYVAQPATYAGQLCSMETKIKNVMKQWAVKTSDSPHSPPAA